MGGEVEVSWTSHLATLHFVKWLHVKVKFCSQWWTYKELSATLQLLSALWSILASVSSLSLCVLHLQLQCLGLVSVLSSMLFPASTGCLQWKSSFTEQHCCNNSLLQILSPQQTTSTWPLQLAPGWCGCMCRPTSAAHALTAGCLSLIQDTGTCLPCCCEWLRWLFAVLAPQWWNKVPIDVKTAETLHMFTGRLNTHLFRLHLGPLYLKNLYLLLFLNIALEAYLMKLMYLHNSCNSWVVSTCLNAHIVSGFSIS